MEDYLQLLQRKLILVECYQSLSNRLLFDKIDDFEEILEERDRQIADYKANEEKIKTVHKTASAPVSEILGRIDAVITDIVKIDNAARARIMSERDEILALIESSEKTNRVATYMKQTNFDTTIGGMMNIRL
jgi:succinate dehydrogenase flavin-adding protein (antitoxin of CptAB toxin-antitoxin module)